jgi:hypothetical protein
LKLTYSSLSGVENFEACSRTLWRAEMPALPARTLSVNIATKS